MARRRANGEGAICRREFKRSDGTTYIRHYARITTGYLRGERHSGPLRNRQMEAKEDLKVSPYARPA